MALSVGDRDRVYRAFMRVNQEQINFLKSVLRTAVDNADDWCDAAASAIPPTSYNAALNATFRAAASAGQKALLLALVCWVRAGSPLPEGN